MMTLRGRCTKFLTDMIRNMPSAHVDELVSDLMDFVVAETGRTAEERLDQSLPLCLYFATKENREEFVALMHEARPHMIVKRMP